MPLTTSPAVDHPRPAIREAVMRSTTSPTPRHNTVREQNSLPGLGLGSELR
ncbi:MAG: hypothetical protein ABI277_06730 [Burkholderiaceae bacterium]